LALGYGCPDYYKHIAGFFLQMLQHTANEQDVLRQKLVDKLGNAFYS
jgi:hypothetical protein